MKREEALEIIRGAVVRANPEIETRSIWGPGPGSGGTESYVFDPTIRLADVLLAMEIAGWWDNTQCGVKDGNYFWRVILGDGRWKEDMETATYLWNLRADSLEEQSDETLEFLATLLTPTTN